VLLNFIIKVTSSHVKKQAVKRAFYALWGFCWLRANTSWAVLPLPVGKIERHHHKKLRLYLRK
jgi:hypothetical protein